MPLLPPTIELDKAKIERKIEARRKQFWHVSNSVDLNYSIDWDEEDFETSVS